MQEVLKGVKKKVLKAVNKDICRKFGIAKTKVYVNQQILKSTMLKKM